MGRKEWLIEKCWNKNKRQQLLVIALDKLRIVGRIMETIFISPFKSRQPSLPWGEREREKEVVWHCVVHVYAHTQTDGPLGGIHPWSGLSNQLNVMFAYWCKEGWRGGNADREPASLIKALFKESEKDGEVYRDKMAECNQELDGEEHIQRGNNSERELSNVQQKIRNYNRSSRIYQMQKASDTKTFAFWSLCKSKKWDYTVHNSNKLGSPIPTVGPNLQQPL